MSNQGLSDQQNKEIMEAQTLAIQYFRAGNFTDALAHAKIAADIARGNLKLQNLAGAIALETKDAPTALIYLDRSLSISLEQVEALFLKGNALSMQSMNEEAVEYYDRALRLAPDHIDAMVNQGFCYDRTGQPGKAEKALAAALRIDPNHALANNAMAELLSRKTIHNKALVHAQRAVDSDPNRVEFFLTLARLLRQQNQNREAEKIYRSALSVHPNNPTLIIELGGTLRDQNLFDEAEEHYQNALKLAPKNTKVLRSAGAFFQSISRHTEALDAYERYIALRPDDAGMLNNLAIILRDLNRFEEAEKYYLECAKREQDKSYVYNNLAILAMEMGKPEESIQYYKKALDDKPQYTGAHSNMLFYMNYLSSMSAQEIFEEHKRFAIMHTEPFLEGTCVHANDPSPDRRLKIGYVSADLYGHAVSYFIQAALKNHDRSNYEVFCYAHVRKPDGMTKQLREFVPNWFYIHDLSTKEVVELIKSHEIDILIDLGGHTAGNRLQVFGYKPAPVQVTWIGYPNTTGLNTIDYRFVDEITDPTGEADQFHTEKLWRLPECFTCYTPQAALPDSKTLAAKKTGQVTFGSFNNASKLSPATIEAWAKILNKVEGSRLLLKSASLVDEGTQERFFTMFESHGVPSSRVEMMGKLSSHDHMRLYDSIDIGLDPFPYNGTTTSCEALFMGVPIVAVLGDRHAARVTGSLLHQVGLGDLATNNVENYVNKAVELANDLDRLESIRVDLRENMINSPLCDQQQHTRNVEQAYRQMWSIWCEEEPKRRQERERLGRPKTKPYKPVVRLVHALGNAGFVQFSKCLSVMKNVALLSDLHPLGMLIFPPYQQAQKRFRLFEKQEMEYLLKKPRVYDEAIARIYEKLTQRDKNLVITDWCHLDFVAQPYLPVPAYELATDSALSERFELQEIFVMGHPATQWNAYTTETNVGDHVTPEEFLYGYRKFAEYANREKFYKIEDFSENPTGILQEVCSDLDLEFNPDFDDEWPFSADVGGDAFARPLEARAHDMIVKKFYPKLPDHMLERMQASDDYAAILKLLNYD